MIQKKINFNDINLIKIPRDNFFLIYIFQAYAELEKDTPGQILGVTFKSDGKSTSSSSSSEPISEKFTQRPQNEDTYYEEHDIKETKYYKQRDISPRIWFAFGFMLIFLITSYLMSSPEDYAIRERDKTLAKLKKQEHEKQFDDA